MTPHRRPGHARRGRRTSIARGPEQLWLSSAALAGNAGLVDAPEYVPAVAKGGR